MKQIFVTLFFILFFTTTKSQQITKEDYARAVSFLWTNLNNKAVYNAFVDPVWFKDSMGVAYIIHSKEGKSFNKISWNAKGTELLFDHEKLAKLLSDSLQTEIKATDLPLTNLLVHHKNKIDFTAKEKTYTLQLPAYTLTLKKSTTANNNQQYSPDSSWIAYTENFNLYIRSAKTGEKKQLSFDGQKNYEYATWYGWSDIIEGENGERPPRFRVMWSPDSKWIQTYIADFRTGNKMYLLDWSIDTLYRPKLLSYYRASPGDTNMVYMLPVFFNIERGEEIKRNEARTTHTFPASYEWTKQPGVILEEIRVRGFQEMIINELNLLNNKERKLYSETSKTNIDNFSSQWIEEWNSLLITSEKDGWKQIYLVDAKDASVKPVTNGAYYVNQIVSVDRKGKAILFGASGKEEGRNPYHIHLYRIGMDGKGLRLLTPENSHHDFFISPDGKYIHDDISAHNQPTVTVLRSSADGKTLHTISKASVDGLQSLKYKYPEVFTTIARDGVTTIYSMIWKPTNFDSTKKYPVIDQSYTGPHTNMFPRSFGGALARGNQALAELGFIVVTIDGMGTAGRSKAFQSVSYKNMSNNLVDHVIAIKDMGRKFKWIDTTRVGIFGHSAGGYDAGHAVLKFPDFYKVAVASSADHDFRMEKDWWPEMYMGWPVDSSYHYASNITMAHNLKGKLLITHGGIDENVNPSATFKLAEALIKADKEFDMLIFPSQRHGYTGKYNEYFTKKRWNYFVEHLHGQKAIWDFEFK